MNFLNFIENNQSVLQSITNKSVKTNEKEKKKEKEPIKDKKTITDKKIPLPVEQKNVSHVKDHVTSYVHKKYFRKGDFVTVIKGPISYMNVYKGYHGEIYDYVKNSNYALVIIDCLNAIPVRLHIDHLIKRNF
jgi:hypothetical protein